MERSRLESRLKFLGVFVGDINVLFPLIFAVWAGFVGRCTYLPGPSCCVQGDLRVKNQ